MPRDFIGTLYLFSLIGPWMLSFILPVLTIFLCLMRKRLGFFFAAGYVSWIIYRQFVPKGLWPPAREFMAKIGQKHRYYEKQLCLLDDGLTPDDLKANSRNLLCFHPHGIFAIGWSLNGSMGAVLQKSEFSFMVTENLLRLPIVGDILSWYGCSPANKKNMMIRMKAGQNLALLPGGFEEAACFEYGKHRVFIKKRAGFIKYALEHGYRILPTYSFGEEFTYHSLGGALPLRWWLNSYHIPTVIFYGKYFLPLMPFDDHAMTTVIGRPLQLPAIPEPTVEDVNLWHNKYMAALQDLFDRNIKKYGHDKNAKLEMY